MWIPNLHLFIIYNDNVLLICFTTIATSGYALWRCIQIYIYILHSKKLLCFEFVDKSSKWVTTKTIGTFTMLQKYYIINKTDISYWLHIVFQSFVFIVIYLILICLLNLRSAYKRNVWIILRLYTYYVSLIYCSSRLYYA